MTSAEYSSKRIPGLRRPPRWISTFKMAGALLLALGMTWILIALAPVLLHAFSQSSFWYPLIEPSSFARALSHAHGDRLLQLTSAASFLVAGLLVAWLLVRLSLRTAAFAFRSLWTGLHELIRPYMPARVPNDISGLDDLDLLFRQRTLRTTYEQPSRLLTALFGKNALFIPPSARAVADFNAVDLTRRLRRAVLPAALIAMVIWGIPWLDAEGMLDTGALASIASFTGDSHWTLLVIPLSGLLVLNLVLALLDFLSVNLLIPDRAPSTEAQLHSRNFEGFGHPQQLLTRLPDIARQLAWEGFENRVRSTGIVERGSTSVADQGAFGAVMFIEEQPRPIPSGNTAAATLLFAGGWLLWLATIVAVVTMLIPAPLQDYLETGRLEGLFTLAPVYVFLAGSMIKRATGEAIRLLRQAHQLLEALRFESQAVLIDLDGVMSRASVTVGRARNDSIESSNEVMRSDLTTRIWAGRLESETRSLDSERVPLSVAPSAETAIWIETLESGMAATGSSGVKPMGLDLAGSRVQEIVQANATAQALGQLGRKHPQRLLREGVGGIIPPPQPAATPALDTTSQAAAELPQPTDGIATDDPDIQSGDLKECPECAEMVRARARKCRFCGYRFDEAPLADSD